MNNLFSNLPTEISSELIDSLLEKPGIRIERIVSQGQVTAAGEWYDQEENEWVIVLRGQARLRLEGDDQMREMRPGDHLNIPAHQRHRVDRRTDHLAGRLLRSRQNSLRPRSESSPSSRLSSHCKPPESDII